MTITAVIVTRDRRELLRACLDGVLGQDRAPDRVLVVDNRSSDGTAEMLAGDFAGRVDVVRTARNGGSAGGFAAGIAAALAGPGAPAWLWLLDDDTIPAPAALGELERAIDRARGLPEPALLASKVLWTDGSLHPMNQPWPRWDDDEAAVGAIARGLLAVRAATYVSILVRADAVRRTGGPREPFFVWGDDVDFTARLLRQAAGYHVPESVVEHRTATDYAPQRSSSERYALDVRNKLWMLRGDAVWSGGEKLWWSSLAVRNAGEFLRFNRCSPRAARILARGVVDGLRRIPA